MRLFSLDPSEDFTVTLPVLWLQGNCRKLQVNAEPRRAYQPPGFLIFLHVTDGIDRRCDVGVKTDRQVLDARRTNGVPLDATVQVSVAGTLMLPIAALILLARGFRQCRAAGKRQWQASRGR